jgi:hypothetical protein
MGDVMNVTVETQVDVNIKDVWEMMWGCDGAGFAYWVSKVRRLDDGSFSPWVLDEAGNLKPNPQNFIVYTEEDDDWHTITLEKIAKGYAQARAEGVTHCSGCNIDDADACVEDIILQYAAFGEMVYG